MQFPQHCLGTYLSLLDPSRVIPFCFFLPHGYLPDVFILAWSFGDTGLWQQYWLGRSHPLIHPLLPVLSPRHSAPYPHAICEAVPCTAGF